MRRHFYCENNQVFLPSAPRIELRLPTLLGALSS